MLLNQLRASDGSRCSAKRLGRGIGSGYGKTCGKGHKGQKARAGGFRKRGFEGGQMPLQRRLPKIGFTSRANKPAGVRVEALESFQGQTVSFAALRGKGLVSRCATTAKVVVRGELRTAITIEGAGISFSEKARLAIAKAGGRILAADGAE